jgi:hypothetical protein
VIQQEIKERATGRSRGSAVLPQERGALERKRKERGLCCSKHESDGNVADGTKMIANVRRALVTRTPARNTDGGTKQ